MTQHEKETPLVTTFPARRFQLGPAEWHNLFHAQPWKGLDNACRDVPLCAAHGLPSKARFRSLCLEIQRQLSHAYLFLPRSVSLHGLCSIDVSHKPPGYRNLSQLPQVQVISFLHL